MQELIASSLANLGREFQENELAYLALTTKIELPIRDRLAFILHRQLNEKFNISREWKRTDLAILDGQNPRALIELKAMYVFDAALDQSEICGYAAAMAQDEIKAKKLATGDTEVYTVLLATHSDSHFPLEMSGIIKYITGINKAFKKYNTAEKIKDIACEAVDKKLSTRNVIAVGEIYGGQAFNSNVSVLYWVIKA